MNRGCEGGDDAIGGRVGFGGDTGGGDSAKGGGAGEHGAFGRSGRRLLPLAHHLDACHRTTCRQHAVALPAGRSRHQRVRMAAVRHSGVDRRAESRCKRRPRMTSNPTQPAARRRSPPRSRRPRPRCNRSTARPRHTMRLRLCSDRKASLHRSAAARTARLAQTRRGRWHIARKGSTQGVKIGRDGGAASGEVPLACGALRLVRKIPWIVVVENGDRIGRVRKAGAEARAPSSMAASQL